MKNKIDTIDSFSDYLTTVTTINEMAYNRKAAVSKIDDISYPIINHLVKILKYKDPINFNKHCNDINEWIATIQRIKIKSGSLSQKDYYNAMWDLGMEPNNYDVIKRILIKQQKDYGNLEQTDLDYKELFEKIKDIFIKLSKDIGPKLTIDIRDYL